MLSLYHRFVVSSDAYRRAIDCAGDDGLPGARVIAEPENVLAFAVRIGEAGCDAYGQFLALDDRLAILTWLSFLSVALLAWRRLPSRGWSVALVIAATAAAVCDLRENDLLRGILASPAHTPASLLSAAVLATTGKWLALTVSAVLVFIELIFMLGRFRAWTAALFLDVPYLIDSATRRVDFHLHREFIYDSSGGAPRSEARSSWVKPAFWFYAVTVMFASFGPTWDGICTAVPALGTTILPWIVVDAVAGAVICLAWTLDRWLLERLERRFSGKPADWRQRRRIASIVMWACFGLLLAPLIVTTGSALSGAMLAGPCAITEIRPESLWRLLLCAGVIGLFGLVWRRTERTNRLIYVQGGLILGAALAQWWYLAHAEVTAADHVPYRHVFAVLAPTICVTLCAAPSLARAIFAGPWSASTAARFTALLPQREVFVDDRTDPVLTFGRVVQAFAHGAIYRPLHLLLPPAVLALFAPADWAHVLFFGALVFSLFLATWGSITGRWEQLVLHVDRWFMTGTSFLISMLVITVAVLRVWGVGYVTTVLDAAPLGVLFGAVAMSYVLSWLVEYWLNRVAAVELLRLLGSKSPDILMAYTLAKPDPNVHVKLADRYVISHGLGRFAVIGEVDRVPPRPVPETAFHTYDLLGLFRALAGPSDQQQVAEVGRRLDLYFYAMNFLLILALAGLGAYVYFGDGGKPVRAVVQAGAAQAPEKLIDLAGLLRSQDARPRPAVVVVASGGGTRAALYTAHVLQGLHRLGADREIVLMSGVSGGGVALAYFAANHGPLTKDRSPQWSEFLKKMAEPFIQDVLGGASEWRIVGRTPLTALLAESFDRRLLGKTTFELLTSPPLILNTTVVGHPLEDSDVLVGTVRVPKDSSADHCGERQRPYRQVSGGRLIFTNLANTSSFPKRESTIPDTRLPYQIVRDVAVPLAHAAALNANFPPVFQNARVVLTGAGPEDSCTDRSYFVTDGGAEENLGLVSALFAVHSALTDVQTRCEERGRRCPGSLRPIHFVLAEASATAYDYEPDRGVSAAVSGAKERMTGGLTEALIEKTNMLYRELMRDPKATLEFHYLALPLAFRSRGGFGTHWMHPPRIVMTDPRARYTPGWRDRVDAPFVDTSVTADPSDLTELWSALHDPDTPFCSAPRFTWSGSDTVRRWICGAPGEAPRDLHIHQWKSLVEKLRVTP